MSCPSLVEDSPVGREKLIDAAIRLFGRDGFDATSLRAIADEAGVSWGLVRFYFGSKDGLREAADHRVITGYMDRVLAAANITTPEEHTSLIESQTEGLSALARYLRRAIMEERPIALVFLRELLETQESLLTKPHLKDETGYGDTVRPLVIRLGYLLLAPQIETLTGRDVFSVDELKRRNALEARISQLVQLGLSVEQTDTPSG